MDGKTTGNIIVGEVLEAAVRWRDFHLLFVSDDIPFEDSLRIYLFDAHWKLADSATLGAMYSTGVFSNLKLIPPNNLRFTFFGEPPWTLELLAHTAISCPYSDPRGVSRPFSLFKRFRIHGHTVPDKQSE